MTFLTAILTWHTTQLNHMQLRHNLPVLECLLCKGNDIAWGIASRRLQ
jgi:hypothetical protein